MIEQDRWAAIFDLPQDQAEEIFVSFEEPMLQKLLSMNNAPRQEPWTIITETHFYSRQYCQGCAEKVVREIRSRYSDRALTTRVGDLPIARAGVLQEASCDRCGAWLDRVPPWNGRLFKQLMGLDGEGLRKVHPYVIAGFLQNAAQGRSSLAARRPAAINLAERYLRVNGVDLDASRL
jgi:hypothetical protein